MGYLRTLILLLFGLSGTLGRAESDQSEKLCPVTSYFNKKDHQLFIPSALDYGILLSTKVENLDHTLNLKITEKAPVDALQFKEGSYELSIKSRTPQNYRFISDATPPKTKVQISAAPRTEKDGHIFYGKGFSLDFEGQDDLSDTRGVYLRINEGKVTDVHQKNLAMKDDGKYQLDYFACDFVGNQEYPRSLKFILDTTAPTTTSQIKSRHPKYLSPKTLIELRSSDKLVGTDKILFRLNDAEFSEYLNEISLGELASGNHTLEYYSVDRLNNREELKKLALIVDSQPPEISIKYPKTTFTEGDLVYVAQSQSLPIVAKDDLSGVDNIMITLNKKAITLEKKQIKAPSKVGLHKISLSAKDLAGNSVLNEANIYVDPNAPQVRLQTVSSVSKRKERLVAVPPLRFSFHGEDNESGLADIYYCVDDAECQPYSGSVVEISQLGQKKISFYAIDRVGNRSEIISRTYFVEENKSITAKAQVADEETKWVYDQVKGAIGPSDKGFTLTISDSLSGEIPGFNLVLPIDAIKDQFLNRDKTEKLIRIALAGHEATISLPIDDKAPQSQLIPEIAKSYQDQETLWFGPGLNIRLISADTAASLQAGVDRIMYSINESPYREYTKSITGLESEQEYSISYYAIDRIGNKESLKTFRFSLDASPPISTVTFQGPSYRNSISSKGHLNISGEDRRSGVAKTYAKINDDSFFEYQPDSFIAALRKLPAGEHQLTYYSIDNVGNQEAYKTKEFILDMDGPLLSYSFVGPHFAKGRTHYINPKSTMYLDVRDEYGGVASTSINLGNSTQEVERTVDIGNLIKDEPSQFALSASDNLGNRSSSEPIDIIKDTTPPRSRVEFIGRYYSFGDVIFLNTATKIDVISQDEQSGVAEIKYRLKAGDFKTFVDSLAFSSQGETSLTFYAVDQLGNRERPQTFRIIVDSEPPQLSLSDRSGKKLPTRGVLNTGELLQIKAFDSHSGIRDVLFRINGGKPSLYRKPIVLKEKGKISLVVEAVDWMGKKHEEEFSYLVQ
ncbi:OmpL47-type beta-barrel domain-containing protein [Pseudobacteriovorax antillogorgiicola]|uniref:Ig-like domain (Group 3) n=1 Tax=Pseudobacteriovorax antillogorgiicola TaxID=1513793 RepID=A0A1Y6B5I1_9BACT|nr:hypothetical protein [Pseudobacteriovorax antillogorgiicola]TCS58904.1 hypothetical protein EDD56_102419 [Pseudobacteriovorax antillogorgiicola]SME93347.1 hypothetical protein SAMN06296036_10224 [Pseudobacteriovorax antillogorgiicola]